MKSVCNLRSLCVMPSLKMGLFRNVTVEIVENALMDYVYICVVQGESVGCKCVACSG